MWRVLVFIALLAIAAFGAVWLANQPGSVEVVWGGYQARTTLAVALGIGAAVAFALFLLWSIIHGVLRVPARLRRATRDRRRSKGYAAVSQGMIAVGAGDPGAARRHASDAQRLLGQEPLALLLTAQSAQIAGDRSGAEAAFRAMTDRNETRILGLRGLHVEARRRGDLPTARAHAIEAARLAPAASWANEAVLEGQCADGDWRGALDTVERRAALGLLDKGVARRHRAVLLAADALARVDGDESGALASALESVRLAPDLVPAAALAGRLLAERGDLKKASKVLEAAWTANPHPDLADVYLRLRPGDAVRDRLARAERLAKLSSWAPEARLAIARAALDAREFDRARHALSPLVAERPTVRTCLLMAEIEAKEHGASGRSREWLARATHAARDPAWMADGLVSDRWSPISPVSGALDVFVWRTPPDMISGKGAAVVDQVLADLDDHPDDRIGLPAPRPMADVDVTEAEVIAPARTEAGHAPEPVATSETVPAQTVPAPAVEAAPVETQPVPPAVQEPTTKEPTTKEPAAEQAPTRVEMVEKVAGEAPKAANGVSHEPGDAKPAVFPLPHVPDDPGPAEKTDKPARFRLFG
jgi:HemY protein